MRQTNLSNVDLNLLVALEALLAEGSVSRAARRCGLSQPAMSRALSRLRDLLGDPLMVRAGHTMVTTPRGRALQRPLQEALEAVRRTLDVSMDFDPAQTQRSFSMSCLDTTQLVVLPPLLNAMTTSAPGVRITTAPLESARRSVELLATGELDFAIGRFGVLPPGVHLAHLYSDRMICLVRSGHPRVKRTLSMKRYLAESHLSAETVSRPELPFTVENLLGAKGLSRRVVATLSNLALAPFIVSRTDLVCTAVERTILPYAAGLGLRALPAPFDSPELRMDLVWHERVHHDAGHRWLRDVVLGLFRDA